MTFLIKSVKNTELAPFSFQRCYFPQVIPKELMGRYAFVTLNNDNTFFVRLYINIHSKEDDICILDESVQCFPRKENTSILQKSCNLNNIQLISTVNYIRTLHISLVFKTTWEAQKWRRSSKLNILKLFLQMFVHVNNSILNCDSLSNSINKINLYCVIVHNIGNIPAGKVVNNTRIVVEKLLTKESFLFEENGKPKYPGFSQPYNKLKLIISNYINNANIKETHYLKIVLVGPPGSGKKTLARQVLFENDLPVFTLEGRELAAGQTTEESQKYWINMLDEIKSVSKEGPCVLLLLHLDILFFCKSHRSTPRNRFLLSHFLNFIDSTSVHSCVIIIATVTSPHNLPSSLRTSSRFQHSIYLGVHTEKERCEMLNALCHDILKPEDIIEVAQKTSGCLFADLDILARRVRWKLSEVCKGITNTAEFRSDEVLHLFKECLIGYQKSCVRGEMGFVRRDISPPEQLGGLFEIQEDLVQLVKWPLLYKNLFEHFNIKKSSGILLYGPPGCAKTSLVRSLTGYTSLNFLSVSAADLFSPYVGDSEAAVTHLFNQARLLAPTVLFIDEIDALVGSRNKSQKGHPQERVLNSFLVEMDGVGIRTELAQMDVGIVVIGATNRPQCVDPALLRPGRFDRLIYVPPPDEKARRDILQVFTQRIPLSDCVDLNAVAKETHLYSGADLASLCRQAGLEALSECMEAEVIQQKHFKKALELIKSSLSEEQVARYHDVLLKGKLQ